MNYESLLILMSHINTKVFVEEAEHYHTVSASVHKLMYSNHGFYFILHLLVSWNPDDRDECHGSEPGQGEVKHVVEFQQSSNCADEKNRKVGQAKS